MAATAWTLTNNARMRRAKGNWNIDTATLKVALFQSTSNISVSSTTYAALTNEVAAANGYTTGGGTLGAVDLTFTGTNPVNVAFVSNPTYTATGGNITGIRTAVLYEVSGDVYCFSTLDSTDITISTGTTYTVNNTGSNPVFQVV